MLKTFDDVVALHAMVTDSCHPGWLIDKAADTLDWCWDTGLNPSSVQDSIEELLRVMPHRRIEAWLMVLGHLLYVEKKYEPVS
jgi:hypothetical protein